MVTQISFIRPKLEISWEPLPANFALPDDPVENIQQPFLAAALTEALDANDRLTPEIELNPAARQIVLEACLFFNQQRYNLFALIVIPDHIYCLIQPLQKTEQEFWPLSSIMNSIKGYSAKQIPQVMNHIRTIWQDERHDCIIRNEAEFQNTWDYIRQKPGYLPLLKLILFSGKLRSPACLKIKIC